MLKRRINVSVEVFVLLQPFYLHSFDMKRYNGFGLSPFLDKTASFSFAVLSPNLSCGFDLLTLT